MIEPATAEESGANPERSRHCDPRSSLGKSGRLPHWSMPPSGRWSLPIRAAGVDTRRKEGVHDVRTLSVLRRRRVGGSGPRPDPDHGLAPRSAACWSAARRARPRPPWSGRWPTCCRPSPWSRAAGSAATPAIPIPTARTARMIDAAGSGRRPARLVELPVGATEDRVIGSLDLQAGAGRRPGRLRARAAGRRAPRHPLRRRSQPAARPSGRSAAGRRRDGPLDRGTRRRLGRPRLADGADRHDEPGGGRAPPAAAGPVRADGGDRRPAGPAACGPRWSAAGWPSTAIPRPSRQRYADAEAALQRADRHGPQACSPSVQLPRRPADQHRRGLCGVRGGRDAGRHRHRPGRRRRTRPGTAGTR